MKNLVAILLTSQSLVTASESNETIKVDFKDQPNFIQMRNQMNEENEKSHELYETLNEKLSETGYIGMAAVNIDMEKDLEVQMVQSSATGPMTDLEATCYLNKYPDVVQAIGGAGDLKAAKKHWDDKGKKEKRTKTCDEPLTDEEAQCYIDRFPDLQTLTKMNKKKANPLKIAKRHYMDWGIYEGRNRNCAQRITDQQAQCYLDKYADLAKKFGDEGWIEAKEHYYKTGWKEGRDYRCSKKSEPFLCANEGQDCSCENGLVFFTKREFSADKNNQASTPATWDQAINYAFLQTDPIHSHLKCDAKMIGDMAPGFAKQCFCERKLPKKPQHCAKEGSQCECPAGAMIFYGAQSTEKNVNATFSEMTDTPYALTRTPQSAHLVCDSESFRGDPLPGQSKQCFCDQDNYYKQEWVHADMDEFAAVRAQQEAERLAKIEEAKRLALEKEAARIAAEAKAEKERLEKERLRKINEARKAADDIREKAFAEANKEREAAIKKEKADQDKAQKAELAADEAEHEAELERLAAIQAEKDAENAKAIDRAQKRLEAHQKRIEAEEKRREAEEAKRRAQEAQKQAEVEARIEKQRIATQEAKAKLAAIQARDDEVARAAADAARQQALEQKAAAAAQARAAEAKRTQAAVQAQVMAAIEEFQRAEAAKAAEIQAEKDRIAEEQKLAEEKERQRILAEQAADDAAEEKAKEEARLAKLAAIEAEKRAYQEKKEEEAEARRLADEARQQKLADEKARHEELLAEKAEQLAKSQEDIEKAKQRREAAQELVRQAEEQRQKIADEKRNLEERKAANELREQMAQEREQKAIAAQKAAEEKIKIAKEQAAAARKRAEERMKQAEAETKAHKEKLEAAKKANIKKLADMAEKQRLAIKAAQEAHQLAHEQAVAARAAQEARQLADHKAKMAERKAAFADQYPHVWIAKESGITQCQITMPDLNSVDNLVPVLWHYNLVADIETISEGVIRTFVRGEEMQVEDGDFKLIMTTADERVDMLKSVIFETSFKNEPNFDFVTFSPATGNKKYIEWVKQQTLTNDGHDESHEDDDILDGLSTGGNTTNGTSDETDQTPLSLAEGKKIELSWLDNDK